MSTTVSGGLVIAMPPFHLLSNGQNAADSVLPVSTFRFAIRNLAGSPAFLPQTVQIRALATAKRIVCAGTKNRTLTRRAQGMRRTMDIRRMKRRFEQR